jgi:hypothetical protein
VRGGRHLFTNRVANSQAGIEALLARAGKAAAQVRWPWA